MNDRWYDETHNPEMYPSETKTDYAMRVLGCVGAIFSICVFVVAVFATSQL